MTAGAVESDADGVLPVLELAALDVESGSVEVGVGDGFADCGNGEIAGGSVGGGLGDLSGEADDNSYSHVRILS